MRPGVIPGLEVQRLKATGSCTHLRQCQSATLSRTGDRIGGYWALAAAAFPTVSAFFASFIPDWMIWSQSRCGIGEFMAA